MFSQGHASLGLDLNDAIAASIRVAVADTDPEDLVTALAAHTIALLAMVRPHDPESLLDELEQLTTISRLDGEPS